MPRVGARFPLIVSWLTHSRSPLSHTHSFFVRSVPSAGSPKSSDIDDLAIAGMHSADELDVRKSDTEKSMAAPPESTQRRAAQNKAEKERRNILKSGFEELKVCEHRVFSCWSAPFGLGCYSVRVDCA